MTFPLWMLLGFAMWTAAVLVFAIGTYRFSYILTGRAGMAAFPADGREGAAWYQRAMRAHANCIENLALFTVVVFALYASGISSPVADAMAGIALAARICQSLVHICFVHTNTVASVRFGFYFVQFVCFVWLAAIILINH